MSDRLLLLVVSQSEEQAVNLDQGVNVQSSLQGTRHSWTRAGIAPAPHAVTDGGRAALLRHARHSCKQRDTNLYILIYIYIYCTTLQVVSPAALCEIHSPGLTE